MTGIPSERMYLLLSGMSLDTFSNEESVISDQPGTWTPGDSNGTNAIFTSVKKSSTEELRQRSASINVRQGVIGKHLPRKATIISLRLSSRTIKPLVSVASLSNYEVPITQC
jgi:hypothetical protein